MKIIGLTGGSGAGKTAVSACFEALGAGTVDADAVYRRLCAENRAMLEQLRRAFSDPEKLNILNALTFPYSRAASEAAFMGLAQAGHTVILYDAPTLFQTGADALCGAVIGVVASRETRLRRIISRDNIPEAAAAARIDSQPDEAFYRRRCRFIIENDGAPAQLEAQAKSIWNQL